MKNYFLSIIFLLSFSVHANNWQEFGRDSNGHIHYVDMDNIEEGDGVLYYWSLMDFLETTSLGTRSNVSKYKVDCADENKPG